MKLSKTTAHAILALGYLASQPGTGPVQARQVADHLNIPTDSALKMLQNLARHGLVQSRLGRGGGYRIASEPHLISLLQVVEAVEGPLAPQLPVDGHDTITESLDWLRDVCDHTASHLRSQLQRFSIAELVNATETLDEPFETDPEPAPAGTIPGETPHPAEPAIA